MKPTAFITSLTALSLAVSANANVTVNITGATAFRAAAVAAIRSKFVGNYQYAHSSTAGNVGKANESVFIGTYTGISGVTTIRCTWSGSVEGVRSMVAALDPTPPKYLLASVATTAASAGGGETAAVVVSGTTAATATSDFAFSDVNTASTPYSGATLTTDPVGVIVFTMMANDSSAISNVTSQQFRALMTQPQPLSLLTGVSTDSSYVYAIGRNDLSGTRTTALAETGAGITNPVNQYLVTGSGDAMSALTLVPGTTGTNTDSTVWGQNQDGNGGYNSGGNVATALGYKSTGATVSVDGGAAEHVDIVSWLGVSDAAAAKTAGGKLCGFNGVSLDLAGASNTLSASDINKIAYGQYTAWGFERMFYRTSLNLTSDTGKVFTAINTAVKLPANLGTAGIDLGTMKVGRSTDGGLVAP